MTRLTNCDGCGRALTGKQRRWCSEHCRKHKRNKCIDCGAPCEGKRCIKHHLWALRKLKRQRRLEREHTVLSLRKQGYLNTDIAIKMRLTVPAVASLLHRMKERGVKIPPSTYDAHQWAHTGRIHP